ncbi:MAG: IS21 family transposase [Planctomycetaceae bacterium]|jgi:transposase|nr:IS21 family transposase [Planctomycetaceae bacterium]MBV8607564.1 IS21 family transposase [Singulisphaera sp.]MBV8675584.1 IS21 family transposase [Planctomycetaceae bacterium]
MHTVDDYAKYRTAHRDGWSIRQIARSFHVSRRTVREALASPEPKPYTRTKPPPAPVLGPFTALIDQILRDDRDAPPKQRHTAAQLFRRLQDEHGYPGSYPTVRRYVAAHRQRSSPTFIPLAHPPGHRLEADFGHIHVDFPDGRRLVPVLVTVWAYSNAPFVLALPTERTEAILHGMVRALEFFGASPREVWWDNPKTVATTILRGRQRQLHPRYAALASHYTFEAKFCLPAQAHEKPDVESGVRAVQRRFATPVPRVADITELNEHMRQRCLDERRRAVRSASGAFVIGDRLTEELAAAVRLPERVFDPCIERQAVADKYQTVAFDANRYSVPRPWAFRAVTVKGYVDRVVVVAGGRVVAEHPRCYDRSVQVLDPVHYLATLERRPAALDHAPVYRDWQPTAALAGLRRELEGRHGTPAGTRQFIRVLQLLAEHPQARVERAIAACRAGHAVSAEAIIQRTRVLAAAEAGRTSASGTSYENTILPPASVPPPDLSRFNRLLDGAATAEWPEARAEGGTESTIET